MRKPSEYFIDKSESIQLKNALASKINDKNLAVKQMRSQSPQSKKLFTLNKNVFVDNPYSSNIINSEIELQTQRHKMEKEYNKNENVPVELEQADNLIAKHEKAYLITDQFVKELNQIDDVQDTVQITLGEVQIAKKREAFINENKLELRPIQFTLPVVKKIELTTDLNEYVEDKEIDEINDIEEKEQSLKQYQLLDDRMPLRVKEIEDINNREKEGNSDMKSKSVTVEQSLTEAKYRQINPNDYAANSKFLLKTTERMLNNVEQLSQHKYFIDGRCCCPCHEEKEHKTRICSLCLCKYEEQTENGHEINFQSNNLLKNTNLPLYEEEDNENILESDGRLTKQEVINLINKDIESLNPDERILHVSREQEYLANKAWSPKLRSNIAPPEKLKDVQELLNNCDPSLEESQILKEDNYSCKNAELLKKELVLNASRVLISKELTEKQKHTGVDIEKLEKKIFEKINTDVLLEMRKPEISGVEKAIEQSIDSQPEQQKYQFYCPPNDRTLQESNKEIANVLLSHNEKKHIENPYEELYEEYTEQDDEDEINNEEALSISTQEDLAGNLSPDHDLSSNSNANEKQSSSEEQGDEEENSSFQSSEYFASSHNCSDETFTSNETGGSVDKYKQLIKEKVPEHDIKPSPVRKNVLSRYLEPRMSDRILKVKHNQDIDRRAVENREKLKELITDPLLPEMNEKQYEKAINKAYDRLEDLNCYVETKMYYYDEPINFNDYTILRKKHVKSSLK